MELFLLLSGLISAGAKGVKTEMAPLTPTPSVPLPTILLSISMTLGSAHPELLYPKEGSSTGELNNYSIDPEVETFAILDSSKSTNKYEGYCYGWVIYYAGQGEIVFLLHSESNKMRVWRVVSFLGISYYSQVL